MNPDGRLVEIAASFERVGLRFLVMGGHAVRYYGISRDTLDFDFHLSLAAKQDLLNCLQKTGLFGSEVPTELVSWRGSDFRRFLLGHLPSGKEEWLEFWFHNHLLAPFEELHARREEGVVADRRLPFLALPDLIRSKETERESDWQDVALLEEIFDTRSLAKAGDFETKIAALAGLRSRRGYRLAEEKGFFRDAAMLAGGLEAARNPITKAMLLPSIPDAPEAGVSEIPGLIAAPLRTVTPGSPRHFALVEATRRVYRQSAIAADRADKQRVRTGQ